ncbi:MAG: outer membrane protein assembly factor [Micavibrio aeruginosavorus]|uniref:Outer membrane protein assembly factor n=1 Tax=Micavibrio aeruginosavorus TaxID=349221 RepID=A0A2W5A6E3_9BACT|nr:MAG: outer membrane protein assembly factor [Micavibrio aeruginosavorus]
MGLLKSGSLSFRCAVILLGSVSLGACSLIDRLTGVVETDYRMTAQGGGTEKDAEYLSGLIKERVAARTENLADEDEEKAKQEEYLEQTVRADLLKGLYSKGYYDARVQYDDGAKPFSGEYRITYGPQYTISSLDVLPPTYANMLDRSIAGQGDVLDAEKVLSMQAELHDSVQKDRCYYNLDVRNEVYLNRNAHIGDVDLRVDAGREGKFGPVKFEGNDSLKDSYLRRLVTWREGDCFRREKLEDFKTKLLQSGLFAKADAVLLAEPEADGSVPVVMDLRERAHRSIGAGLTYYSDEGPGGVLTWEHRNLLGAAEKLSVEFALSSLKQSLDADFVKPYFLRNDQSLSLTASMRRQDTDAFQELGINTGVGISRNFTSNFSGRTGVELGITRIEDNTDNSKKTFGLVSFPQSLTYDTRDDALDPHKGVNVSGVFEPFLDAFGEANPFTKTQLTGSTYLQLGTSVVLASKAGFGSLWGADIENVPATERFYAGGGGSVRGFGYQEVGPQKDGDPTGGASIVNFSLELRSRFGEKFGGVVFADGASVSEEPSPSFDNIAIGAGVGLRYYTGFGPIRFDIATPLTQKDNLDQNYQFYISIGQAF